MQFLKQILLVLTLFACHLIYAACPTPSGGFFSGSIGNHTDNTNGSDDCSFNAGSYYDLRVPNNNTLTVYGNLEITGDFSLSGTLVLYGTMTIIGNLDIDGDGEIQIISGSELNVTGNVNNGGFWSNAFAEGGLPLEQGGTNSGTINVGGNFNNNNGGLFEVANGGLLDIGGALNNNTGSTMTVQDGGTMNASSVNDNGTLNQPAGDETCDDGCCGAQCGTLPVELVSFTGSIEGEAIVLNWSTATEINNSHFEIEKSLDGVEFTQIGTVDGNGNYSGLIEYQFTDFDISHTHNYYRLKQVDFDGAYEYHPIIHVHVANTNTDIELNVFPNPVSNEQFTLALSDIVVPQDPTLYIFDSRGELQVQRQLQSGVRQWDLRSEASNLKRGYYIVQLHYGSKILKEKIIVQ